MEIMRKDPKMKVHEEKMRLWNLPGLPYLSSSLSSLGFSPGRHASIIPHHSACVPSGPELQNLAHGCQVPSTVCTNLSHTSMWFLEILDFTDL